MVFFTKSRLRVTLLTALALALMKLVWAAAFATDGTKLLAGLERDDVIARRQYLIQRLLIDHAGVSQMPSPLSAQFQGEWALVTYSMTATALANIAFLYPESQQEAREAIAALIEAVVKPEFRDFDREKWREDPLDSLEGDHGHVGYLGHLAWMIGAYRFLGGTDFERLYGDVSHALSRRLLQSPVKLIETYPGQTYIPDNLVAFAALSNFDRLSGSILSAPVEHFLKLAQEKYIDSRTGLLVFSVSETGQPLQLSRGSASGWNSLYLPFVDADLAATQWTSLNASMIRHWPAPGLREFASGASGAGDVDSGPVVFGLSPSGTGFALGGASHNRDGELLTKLLYTAELAGFTMQWNGQRRYLTGPLVGDAIVLAAKTARVWDKRFIPVPGPAPTSAAAKKR